MKKIFILFLSLVFIAAMTGCQTALVAAGTDVTPDKVDTTDTVETNQPAKTIKTAASGGNYTFTLDVNPSIELTVQNGVVTGAAAYNDDGQSILLGANVAGLNVNGAIDAIIEEIAGAGYLKTTGKEPYVLLTVAGGEMESEICEELQEYTEEALEDAGVESEVKSVPVTTETTDGAAAKGMSAGRYLILQYIAKEQGISFDQAVALYGAMSISQLMEQFDDVEEAFDEDGVDDIEDIDDEDIDDEDTSDEDEPDATSGATVNPDKPGSGSQTGQDGQDGEDDEDDDEDEDYGEDNDQEDDQDDEDDDKQDDEQDDDEQDDDEQGGEDD